MTDGMSVFASFDRDRHVVEVNEMAAIQRLVAMLKRLEWADWNEVLQEDICHVCENQKAIGHDQDCDLAMLIKEFSGD